MSSPAFQLYAADHPTLARTLRAKLETLRAEKTAQLVHSQDWPDFQKRRGAIRGIELAITECEQAEKQHGD